MIRIWVKLICVLVLCLVAGCASVPVDDPQPIFVSVYCPGDVVGDMSPSFSNLVQRLAEEGYVADVVGGPTLTAFFQKPGAHGTLQHEYSHGTNYFWCILWAGQPLAGEWSCGEKARSTIGRLVEEQYQRIGEMRLGAIPTTGRTVSRKLPLPASIEPRR